jgi:hypothetical protein
MGFLKPAAYFTLMVCVNTVRTRLISEHTAFWTDELVFVPHDKYDSGNEPEQQQNGCKQKWIDTFDEPPVHVTTKTAGVAFSE